MRTFGVAILCAAGCAAVGSPGCGGQQESKEDTPLLDETALKDPASCAPCHPNHVKEWSGSMHAYASDDPVFLAMNARGQRETHGALGDFCVRCHAPMAVRSGATRDGLNLAEVPKQQRGVTCFFCHSVDAVNGAHDNPLSLATDGVLRGGIKDPVRTGAHRSAYSPLLDREKQEAAPLCGSCHDIVGPAGAHIERTFAEWQGTLFAHPATALTCGQCHMDGREGLAADAPGAPNRRVHAHTFPGVDVALTPFPEAEAQRAAVQQALDTAVQAELCVKGPPGGESTIQVVLDNVGAGHLWPSGAAHDRRAWVEVIAYAGDKPVYKSGAVADGASVLAAADPDLWLIRECIFDKGGKQVNMFWEAASSESDQLPGPTTNVPTDPAYYLTHVVRSFPRPTSTPAVLAVRPDRVTMRVRLVPVGQDVLDDLIATKDLDPAVKSKMPTFTLGGTEIEWTDKAGTIKYLDQGVPVSCVTGGLSTPANAATPAPENTKCSP